MKSLSRVRLFATPWTVAYQAPLSMGFSRQECWSGLPFPSPGDLPNLGIEPGSPALQADALPSEPPGFEGRRLISRIRKESILKDEEELDSPELGTEEWKNERGSVQGRLYGYFFKILSLFFQAFSFIILGGNEIQISNNE